MTFRTFLTVVALCASSAFAQRVSFPSFTGPGAAAVRNQLVGAACDTADCVSASKTTTGGKPDWKKARKESVQFFVTGSVSKRGKALTLDLFIFTKAGAPTARKAYPLDRSGALNARSVQAAMDLMNSTFGSRKAAPPDATPPVEARPSPKDPPPSKPPPSRREDPPPTAKRPPPPEEAPPEETPEPAAKAGKAPFLVVDVGVDILNRKLEYSQVATANLRRYELPLFGQPTIGVQFFPLALMRDDLLAGLGVDVAVGFAPWLQSRLASVTEAFPTSTTRIDVGVRFNIAPIKTFALQISPYLGVRSHSFTVGALADGRRIDGLPNEAFVGLRVGVGVEIPVIAGRLNLFGRFGIVPIFGSGEIISAAFFPNGSAFGLEANGGLGVRLVSFLELRASFEFTRYGLTFNTQPTDTYVAAGASDTWLGGNAALRLSF